jgi:FkbM family methyltransferase
MGELLLRSPAPLRSLRDVPVLGDFIHRLSHRVISREEKFWARIQSGPAEGIWLELNPRTGQSYLRGEAEAPSQKILSDYLHLGMVFYDLGANIGLFSLLASRIVGPAGKVVSFEPDPEIAARLRRNIARNGFTNVKVVESGVWSVTRSVNFLPADASSPDRGTGRFVEEQDAATALVRCIALDDFVRNGPAPHAIKCDVEGAEVEVLRGAENVLRTARPWILCEMHSAANDQAVREFLGRLGYSFQPVDDTHVLALP